jgi:hypothetical protein
MIERDHDDAPRYMMFGLAVEGLGQIEIAAVVAGARHRHEHRRVRLEQVRRRQVDRRGQRPAFWAGNLDQYVGAAVSHGLSIAKASIACA